MEDEKEPKGTEPHANQAPQAQAVEKVAPGAFPTKPSPTIPEWYTVGWRQAVGIDKPPLPEGEEKDNSVLHMFLTEQYYGEWYHNAAIIIFVCIYQSRHCLTFINIVITGCPGYSFRNAFPLWMGMDNSCTCYLQLHLRRFNEPFPEVST